MDEFPESKMTDLSTLDVALRAAGVEAEITSVRLVHTGFLEGSDWDDYRSYFASAWARVLARFTDHFGAPAPDHR